MGIREATTFGCHNRFTNYHRPLEGPNIYIYININIYIYKYKYMYNIYICIIIYIYHPTRNSLDRRFLSKNDEHISGFGSFLCSTNRSLAVKIHQCRYAFPMQKVEFFFVRRDSFSGPILSRSLWPVFLLFDFISLLIPRVLGCCFVILLFCTVFTVL